jgi:hypothetical protein
MIVFLKVKKIDILSIELNGLAEIQNDIYAIRCTI